MSKNQHLGIKLHEIMQQILKIISWIVDTAKLNESISCPSGEESSPKSPTRHPPFTFTGQTRDSINCTIILLQKKNPLKISGSINQVNFL